MRKSFRMFLALALSVLGVLGVNAQRISLQEVPFYSYEGYGPDAVRGDVMECAWELGAPSGCPYGDSNLLGAADLTEYSKLYVTVAEDNAGMRIMLNRLVENGACADTQEASNCIYIPNFAWCTEKYCTQEGLTYIIDLEKIKKDYGFVRLHAIKGASWDSQATIESLEVERATVVTQVGWTPITTNANLEGEDMSNFIAKIAPSADFIPAPVEDSVGVNGTRGIKMVVPAKSAQTWDSQFWIQVPQPLSEGTKYRVFFDAKASVEVAPETQAHSTPGNYLHYEMLGSPALTTEWQSFKYEGTLSASQAGNGTFQSIAFNLAMLDTEIEYYFDNIRFEEYKYGTSATFNVDVIKFDFGFDTNLPELVAASGKPRLMYPDDCVTVKVNGEEVTLLSIEGFADGRFYVFVDNYIADDAEVTMVFTNPADEAYHLVYNGGPGGDVKNFDGVVACDQDAAAASDAYSYLFVTPTLIAADPESGSFNLPNNISEFFLTFDKNVDATQIKATLGNEALVIEPSTDLSETFTLKRTSTNDLATGAYELHITKIFPEIDIFGGEFYGDTTLILNVGKVNLDPSDTVRYVLDDIFASTGVNTIPMGYTVYFQGTPREGGSSQSGGPRMFDFGAGGDFTKGLYYREGYVEYGYVEGYELIFEAGKSYNIHFNTAMWKGDGYTKFEILNELDEIVYEQLIQNKPNVNGSTAAVFSTTSIDIKFQPEADGKYFFKWWNSNANAETGALYSEALLANVTVKYVPNAAGVEETQKVLTALANAKSTRDGNADEKYAGVAYDALVAAIAKYEVEYETYTAPSKYYAAADALDAAVKAVNDHRVLCDTYYALPTKAQEILDNNASKKFANTELYAQLAEVTPNYVTKKTEITVDPETGAETEVVTLEVKKIVEDAELQAAIDELQALVNTTGNLFTEGASKVATTGIAALVERFRLAAAALQTLGVPADDELVVAANNALTDDEDLAEQIKNRMKLEIYGQLKEADNTLFEAVLDTNIQDFVTPTYDLTVFVKNPNIYCEGLYYDAANNAKGWTVPGWSTPDTLSAPGLSTGWNAGTYEIVDCMFQSWKAAYCVEQTIVDLPAGIYNVMGGYGEREAVIDGTIFYARTSSTPVNELGTDTVHAPLIGQTFPVNNLTIPNVVVADGMLTIGVVAPANSTTFFNQVSLYMAGSAAGFDYKGAYDEVYEIIQGVEENVAAPATVLGIELYDLNGRRLATAQQGIVIVKKYMSDGTIRVEKVIKK